jgi:hypothetical protein
MPEPITAPSPAVNQAQPAPAAGATQDAATPTPATQGTTQPPATQGSAEEQKLVDIRALHESREQIRALRTELDALKLQQQYHPQQLPQQQQQFQQPANDVARQLEELWEDDPRKAMQAEVMMALNWYDNSNAEMDRQEEKLASQYTDFNNYRAQIRGYLRSIPVAERAKPGMVESAYYFVKGQSTDTLLKQREEEFMKKMGAGRNATGIGYGGMPTTPTTDAPTFEQQEMAAKMGMSVEDYMKHRR